LRIVQAGAAREGISHQQKDLLGQIHLLEKQLSEGDLQSAALQSIYSRLEKSGAEYQRLKNDTDITQSDKIMVPGESSNMLFVEYSFHEDLLHVFSLRNGKMKHRVISDAKRVQYLCTRIFQSLV
jgi:hypothetical protein